MRVVAISDKECSELLRRLTVGRLGCAQDNQPYIVPVCFSYEGGGHIYLFSTVGKKIEWMRQNPKVCLQADEVGSRANWASVVVNGKYLELRESHYAAERQNAIEKLSQYSQWWRTPLAERREQVSDISIEPVIFRIDIEEMSGLRAVPE